MNYHYNDLETLYENIINPNVDPTYTNNMYAGKPNSPAPVEAEKEEEPQIDLSEFKTEAQIADDIIKEIKVLRRKIGSESYYRASKILRLAEKLKAMHPEKVALP
jgi:hypothetical protein